MASVQLTAQMFLGNGVKPIFFHFRRAHGEVSTSTHAYMHKGCIVDRRGAGNPGGNAAIVAFRTSKCWHVSSPLCFSEK